MMISYRQLSYRIFDSEQIKRHKNHSKSADQSQDDFESQVAF